MNPDDPTLAESRTTKKGEKVDYAILDSGGKPIILLECKTAGVDLVKLTPSQLYRYFSVTDARFGVLTNGIDYRFFSDLEQPNKMDTRPFLEFSMLKGPRTWRSSLRNSPRKHSISIASCQMPAS
jgi:hypothetical protein